MDLPCHTILLHLIHCPSVAIILVRLVELVAVTRHTSGRLAFIPARRRLAVVSVIAIPSMWTASVAESLSSSTSSASLATSTCPVTGEEKIQRDHIKPSIVVVQLVQVSLLTRVARRKKKENPRKARKAGNADSPPPTTFPPS